MPRSKPILIMSAIFAGASVIFGGAALGDFVSAQVIGLATLIIAGARAGIDFYLAGSNTPAAVVVATQDHAGGDVVAGPASSFTTGAAIEPHLAVSEITT